MTSAGAFNEVTTIQRNGVRNTMAPVVRSR
jgi:hypothetical protein